MNTSFQFTTEGSLKVFAYVGQNTSEALDDYKMYTTVMLHFEGIDGQKVYSGTAIAVPQDWHKKFDNDASNIKVIKTGVQLALQRALYAFLNDRFASRNKSYEHNYHSISARFWKAFLSYLEE